ncbi:putative transmembrane protein [Methanothrix thermoacetophila PT]|uniref:Putative transmembrane protein n=1 Tax=Methanothrix thermoacetophila (strain DSM 6194 / JCM 14653 / NBRC 101360 / PT) TaxID=349307 RepID=A0B7S7_METTP|nr:putative transmembrane protein [Methanothrix thermoacetophila PT]
MLNLNINYRIIANPFIAYVYVNLIVFILYQLRWSNLLPKLSTELVYFIFFTVYIMLFIGLLSIKLAIIPKYKPINMTHNPFKVIISIIILIIIEFIHNNGVPLLLLINGIKYNYMSFGIKTLHVFILTFISFYAVYLFHLFVSQKNKKILLYVIILCFYPILIINRGALLIILTSIIFIFLMNIRGLKLEHFIYIVLFLILVAYGFGLLGDLRHGNENYFISISHPSKEFFDSHIPKEFLWAYMYVVSPLGNLQTTINDVEISYSEIEFILRCLVPDFISKHFDFNKTPLIQIAPELNVATMYGAAYASMGWLGMIFIFIYMILIVLLYLIFLPRNTPYTISGIALLTTLIAYTFFTNMLVFTGMIAQLAYPILFGYLFRVGRDKNV